FMGGCRSLVPVPDLAASLEHVSHVLFEFADTEPSKDSGSDSALIGGGAAAALAAGAVVFAVRRRRATGA
ncbi:hypothetical protein ACWCQR_53480, partial [Streptomyces sp. NPDC002172]